MKKALAVARLDFRRLGFGLVSGALVAGLVPSLASGLGEKAPVAPLLVFVFAVAGLAAGGYFGNDFANGRGSFFIARPLSTWTLILGRLLAVLTLGAAAFLAFMTSNWLSTSDRSQWTLGILTTDHAEALGIGWAIALFVALAQAAQGPVQRQPMGLRYMILMPLRMGLPLAVALLTFGLFADLVVRAYITKAPGKIFFGSWIVAFFLASCAGIVAGRTERLRIARFQNGVVALHVALSSAGVLAAWAWVLHPGPGAIERVTAVSGSPDGRSAYIKVIVDRGDSRVFNPVFVLDIASGEARRLDADPLQGPWVSADGGIMAWSEATPYFFRTVWSFASGRTSFRVRAASGETTALPMPSNFIQGVSGIGRGNIGGLFARVLPSADADLFALWWGRTLVFTSRSRGEVSRLDLGPDPAYISAATFLPAGKLRLARQRRDARASSLEFIDVDPGSGAFEVLGAIETPGGTLRLDAGAGRALLTSTTRGGLASISLIDLKVAPAVLSPIVLVPAGINPVARFLADGRIAATTNTHEGGILRVFSPSGQPGLEIPQRGAARLEGEMFPGVLAVSLAGRGAQNLCLVEVATGAILRTIPGVFSPLAFSATTPPPGTPAARLLQSPDGKLFELPSVAAEPRRLLPPGRP
ncbi:MAG TPA: hypothetical protein PLD86_02765 [Vicinamibacteria bacterium]|nr:hypothetical protein [Vicinamibacteria bacterium]